MKNQEFGVLYLAFGAPYLAMALVSLKSLRRSNPDLPVCIVTNVCRSLEGYDSWNEGTDSVRFLEADTTGNRHIKTSIVEHSPFDKTAVLDCDTWVVDSLQPARVYLEYFDLCFKQKTAAQRARGKGEIKVLEEKLPVSELPHWNSGVMFFRKNASVDEFFRIWNSFFASHGARFDQVSLVEAVFRSPCKVLGLDSSWNKQTGRKTMRTRPGIRIVHYASDIDAEIGGQILKAGSWLERSDRIADQTEIEKFILSRRAQRRAKQGMVLYLLRRFLVPFKAFLQGDRTRDA